MIKFVVPRPVKKIHRTYTPRDTEKKQNKRIKTRFFSIKLVWAIFILFALIYGSFLLLKNSIFDHQYTIKRVLYNSGDVARYDDPYMYRRITNWMRGENYYVIKRYTSRIINDIQTKYPMVTNIEVAYRSSNTVDVKITFRPIDMVIRNQDKRFALIQDAILPIYSGNAIANGIEILDLPPYLSGLDTLSGMFFRQSATGLIEQVHLIYQSFPNLHHIEYLPGGERTIVFLDGKKYYINNLGDIPNQIRNYELLKKYYKDFDSLSEVDLGSLEKDKVIVRKF